MSLYIKRKAKPGPFIQGNEAMLEYCNNHDATIFHPSGISKVGTDDVHPCTTGPLS